MSIKDTKQGIKLYTRGRFLVNIGDDKYSHCSINMKTEIRDDLFNIFVSDDLFKTQSQVR